MRISQLPEGLRQLAEKRAYQQPLHTGLWMNKQYVEFAFDWYMSPEGTKFWSEISKGNFAVYHGCKVTNFKRKER